MTESMAISTPPEIRRTATISAIAHVLLLLVLTAVPYVRMPARDMGSYQVVLVSPSAKLTTPQVRPPAKLPTPPPPKLTKPVMKQELPPPPRERPAEHPAMKQVMKFSPQVPPERQTPKIAKAPEPVQLPHAVPKLGEFRRPDMPMEETPPGPSPIQIPRQEAPTKPLADKNLLEALRKAEDNLNRTPTPLASTPPSEATAKRSRATEEIARELNQLTMPKAMSPVVPPPREVPRPEVTPQPSMREEVSRMLADARPTPQQQPAREAPAVASSTLGTARAATLERCPPKAQRYCPLLEAAINRMWNSDYNPAFRQVLESAGNSAAVMLIEIRPDGVIQSIALRESSGNKSYDLAIESLLRDQKRFPPLPEELRGETFKAVTSFKYSGKT
jgi:outer membrane biosynthesis protein TonB